MDILVELLQQKEVIGALLIPITAGLVEVLKRAFVIKEHLLPLISLITGVIVCLTLAIAFKFPLNEAYLFGIVCGLGASGLYDNLQVGKIDGR